MVLFVVIYLFYALFSNILFYFILFFAGISSPIVTFLGFKFLFAYYIQLISHAV